MGREKTDIAIMQRYADSGKVDNKYKPNYQMVEPKVKANKWQVPEREFEFYYTNNPSFRHTIEMNLAREASE